MILCVDPDADSLEATRATMEDAGFETAGATSLAEALDAVEAIDGASAGCLVTEYELPDGTGLELVDAVRDTAPDTACVLFTERSLESIDTAAFGDIVVEYLPRDDPAAREELVDLVEHSVAHRTQTAYPLPKDEEARLAALDEYTGTPEELGGSFDRLTELAVELFSVNSAAVGLIHSHEERFLSCNGASFDPMDREDTICTYAILEAGVSVVENVQEDPRFTENEGLAAAGIRFYAGAPIVTPGGRAIGTVCVHDYDPRSFPERDRELLELLAAEAMEQLALRRRLRDARGGDDGAD